MLTIKQLSVYYAYSTVSLNKTKFLKKYDYMSNYIKLAAPDGFTRIVSIRWEYWDKKYISIVYTLIQGMSYFY